MVRAPDQVCASSHRAPHSRQKPRRATAVVPPARVRTARAAGRTQPVHWRAVDGLLGAILATTGAPPRRCCGGRERRAVFVWPYHSGLRGKCQAEPPGVRLAGSGPRPQPAPTSLRNQTAIHPCLPSLTSGLYASLLPAV